MLTLAFISKNEDKLRSNKSHPIKVKYVNLKAKPAVSNLIAKANTEKGFIHLAWEYPTGGDFRFVIYRAVNGFGFVSYKNIEAPLRTYEDKDVKKGNTYEYTIKVIFKDGTDSGFGGIVKVGL